MIKNVAFSFTVAEVHVPQSRIAFAKIFQNLRFVKKQPAQVYHITGDVHYVAMALPRKNSILTIHDCVFIQDSRGFKRKVLKLLFLDWPVNHVKYITTISQKSKEEIISYTGCIPEKIHVIYNPVGSTIYHRDQPFNKEKPTILFLGTKDHKNLHRAIKALHKIDCHLVVIGKLDQDTTFLLTAYNIVYSQAANISEQAIADKYADADIILFPSLYEGFGLPIIEGNKAGRAVITSNISPMNEVACDAACLVDPNSVEDIRQGVLKVINDDIYRNELVAKGFVNVKRFEPATIADQYIALYKKLL